jgi:tetratricopeptide (TPR) repeat protein
MEERSAVREPATPAIAPTIRDFRRPELSTHAGHRLVAGYEVLSELGQGGMGVVYLARQVQLDRLVALKMIRSTRADREDLLRFRTEAEAVARLAHPNIVQIYEVGEHEGLPFFSLEYCPAGSLDRHLAGQPLPPARAARLIEVLARAVDHAHRHGVVHRDLKPANVLLSAACGFALAAPEEASAKPQAAIPKITDFGLAKRLDGPSQTRAGAIVGTPSYMAPEQAAGQNDRVGPATDVYALGAILYETLAGRPPFQAGSDLETLDQVRRLDPVSPRSLNPAMPRDLETICLTCLRKEPAKRYASAAQLADDLGRWLRSEPITARPVSPLERAARWAWRRPAAAALLLVSTLLVAGLVAAVPLHIAHLRAVAEQARQEGRLAILRADHGELLLAGKHALANDSLQEAALAFRTALEGLRDEPDLAPLRDEASGLLHQTEMLRQRQAGQDEARSRARRFLILLEQAFFQLYQSAVIGPDPAGPRLCRKAARQALELFPNLDCLGADEAQRLRLARQEALFLLAEAEARDGHWHEALTLLEQAEKAAPLLAGTGRRAALHSIHRRRASYLEQLGRPHDAQEQRRHAQCESPAGALDWFLVGLDRQRDGDQRGAVGAFDQALEEQPELFWAQFFRAVALGHLREPAEARAALNLCIRARPDLVWPHVLRAALHSRAGKWSAARADLARAERCSPDRLAQYVIRINRGVLALEQKQPRRAAEHFQYAILLLPDRYHAHANLAEAYRRAGLRDRALATLDHALRLEPGRASLYRTRAWLQRERRRPEAALRDLEQALRRIPAGSPDAATCHRERARILYRQRRWDDCLRACRAALAVEPEEPSALRLEAETLLELGRPREALAAFDRYLKRGPPDVEVHRRRARARAAVGDLAGVVDEYTAALGLHRDAELLAARGWAYLVNSAPRPALRDFQAAYALEPSSEALSGRGTARVELGEVADGVADAEAALRKGPASARLAYNVARVLARAAVRGDDRQARTRADRAVAILRKAMEALPETERSGFWRDTVRRDAVFRPLTRHAGFARLERQFAGR